MAAGTLWSSSMPQLVLQMWLLCHVCVIRWQRGKGCAFTGALNPVSTQELSAT